MTVESRVSEERRATLRMEIVRSGGFAEHAASNGYATTYASFNFGGLDEDREVLLQSALDRMAMLKEIDQNFLKNGRTEEEMQATRNAEVKHRMSVPSKVGSTDGSMLERRDLSPLRCLHANIASVP